MCDDENERSRKSTGKSVKDEGGRKSQGGG